ncbi:MAG: PAS domain-containing protein [candidate division WS1 bacterium]|jgi:PAS domain S-box-containing protein|nr:PAS domain-containing protein [candidate division WS1 bacterium]
MDQLTLLAVSLATVVLGIVVYHRAPDRVWNRLFTVHAFAVSLWVMLNYLIQSASTVSEAELWIRLSHPVVAVVICTCLDLFWVFPNRIDLAPGKYRLILYSVGVAFSSLSMLPALLTSIELSRGTVMATYGWPYIAFGVFVIGTLGYADYVLIRKLPTLTGLQRAQVIYVLVGMLLSQSIAVTTMVILPLIWDNTFYARWGSAAYIFTVGAMAYAIAKQRIVKPIVAFYRISALALTGAVGAALIVVVFRGFDSIAIATSVSLLPGYLIVGLCLGLLAVPVYEWFRHVLERGLANEQVPEVVKQASDSILRTLDVEQLPGFLSENLERLLHPAHLRVFVRDHLDDTLQLRAWQTTVPTYHFDTLTDSLRPGSVLLNAALATRGPIERSQVLRFHSLEEAVQIVGEMRLLDIEIAAPIIWEDELIGMVLISEKSTGEMYAPEELAMIGNMMSQASLAVRNAQLYDEVVRMKEYNDNILSEMNSGVIAIDADENIVLYNPAAEKIVHLPTEQALNQHLTVLPDRIADCLRDALEEHATPGQYRFQLARLDGTLVPVSCSTTGWVGGAASQKGAMVVISDLTLVQELERERQQAEHLSLIRVLSAGMAHEIRNPMVAIRTFAELLPTRWEDADFRESFLVMAQGEIERINLLLADLLMLSKPADAVTEQIDVDDVCRGVVRALSARAETLKVELQMDLRSAGCEPVGDPSRIHQALLNVVTNAVEAEPVDGSVRIATTSICDNGRQRKVLVTVHNPNSHIPADQLDQIFKPFYSRRSGGTGLGLAICQTIVEEHNGDISVRSLPGFGTEFSIHLPLGPSNGEPPYVTGISQ